MKRCDQCQQVKPVDTAFYLRPDQPCKRCHRAARRRAGAGMGRAARAGATAIERIDLATVAARDGDVCHLCRQRITDVGDVTLDHLIPLSRGGLHTLANVAVAHRSCNAIKGTKLTTELLPG